MKNNIDPPIRIKDYFQVIPSANGKLHIRSGDEVILRVSGKEQTVLASVLQAIDGKKNMDQLINELDKLADADKVNSAVNYLFQEGVIENTPESSHLIPESLQNMATYLSHYCDDVHKTLEYLKTRRCLIIGEDVLAKVLADDIKRHGIENVDIESNLPVVNDCRVHAVDNIKKIIQATDFVLTVQSMFLPEVYRQVNKMCLSLHKPSLYVDLSSGNHAVIGPLSVPGQTSCYYCYETRLLANNDAHIEYKEYEQYVLNTIHRKCDFGSLPTFMHIVSSLVVMETLAYLTGYRPARSIDGTLIVDFLKPEIHREPVLKMPDCPACVASNKSP